MRSKPECQLLRKRFGKVAESAAMEVKGRWALLKASGAGEVGDFLLHRTGMDVKLTTLLINARSPILRVLNFDLRSRSQ